MPHILLQSFELGRVWPTADPFLFCVHHDDNYPPGDEELGPIEPLVGRVMGMDFSGRDGWSMYHGSLVPGFPQHPHRGFETISFMRKGFMDHSDSLGAAARFGRGDVQWMTAGSGIVHAEMFPLLKGDTRNPTELFQIWINLPLEDKMAPAHFSMLWGDGIPEFVVLDDEGRATRVTVVAGRLDGQVAPKPPPSSWASRPDTDVNIWHLDLDDSASWTMPPAAPGSNRMLYVFGSSADPDHAGDGALRLSSPSAPAPEELTVGHGALLASHEPVTITDIAGGTQALVLQGQPIGEPVIQYGPFVWTDRAGIEAAYRDYETTGFGGWPWPVNDPHHGHEERRFARHADGKVEEPVSSPA